IASIKQPEIRHFVVIVFGTLMRQARKAGVPVFLFGVIYTPIITVIQGGRACPGCFKWLNHMRGSEACLLTNALVNYLKIECLFAQHELPSIVSHVCCSMKHNV